MSDDVVIRFGDYRTEIQPDGTEKDVIVGIPQCCREGWDSCKHVIKKDNKKRKRNIGL